MIYSKGTMATAMLAASFWADPPHLAAADLKPAAIQAFERYVRAAEARMEERPEPAGGILIHKCTMRVSMLATPQAAATRRLSVAPQLLLAVRTI